MTAHQLAKALAQKGETRKNVEAENPPRNRLLKSVGLRKGVSANMKHLDSNYYMVLCQLHVAVLKYICILQSYIHVIVNLVFIGIHLGLPNRGRLHLWLYSRGTASGDVEDELDAMDGIQALTSSQRSS